MVLSLLAVSYIVPGFAVGGIPSTGFNFKALIVAGIAGACLVFINITIKPIINFLTFPVNLLTLGFFGLVFNGLIFVLLSKMISGFIVTNLYVGIIVAIFVVVLNWLGDRILS